MRKIVLILIVIFTVVLLIVYFKYQDNSLTKIKKANTIRIGYAIEAPFSFVTENGEVTGLSTMEAKEITKRLGIKNIEWRLMEFGSLLSELESDKIDVIAAGMYITTERAKKISFSVPTFHVQQGLAVPIGNPKKLNSYEQILLLSDLKIAVLTGSIEDALLRKIGFQENQLVLIPDLESGIIAVSSGIADALAVSSPTLQWINRSPLKVIEVVQNFQQPKTAIKEKLGYGAFEFQKKDIQLQKAWNNALTAFIGSKAHLDLYAEFGFTKEELPGTISIEEILKQQVN